MFFMHWQYLFPVWFSPQTSCFSLNDCFFNKVVVNLDFIRIKGKNENNQYEKTIRFYSSDCILGGLMFQ